MSVGGVGPGQVHTWTGLLEVMKSSISKVDTEKYVKAGFVAMRECMTAVGLLFETEQIRMTQCIAAAGGVQPQTTQYGGEYKPR